MNKHEGQNSERKRSTTRLEDQAGAACWLLGILVAIETDVPTGLAATLLAIVLMLLLTRILGLHEQKQGQDGAQI